MLVEGAFRDGDASSPSRWISDTLRNPPPLRIPDAECETRAAVTLVLAPDTVSGSEPDGERDAGYRAMSALFVRRAARDGDPWSGHVALPGGRADRADVDLLETAIRETREETSIRLERGQVLGRLDEIHPRSDHLPSIAVTPFVAWSPHRPAVRENHELAGHLWVPLEALRSRRNRSKLVRHQPRNRVFETIEYDDAVIWGLTFAVIENFIRRLDR